MALRKQAIIDVVRKDAEVAFVYTTVHGQTCAIGGLAKAAGVSVDILRKAGGASILLGSGTKPRGEMAEAINTVRRAIAKRYGLRVHEMKEIQHLNDNTRAPWSFTGWDSTRGERRARIIEYVKGLTR